MHKHKCISCGKNYESELEFEVIEECYGCWNKAFEGQIKMHTKKEIQVFVRSKRGKKAEEKDIDDTVDVLEVIFEVMEKQLGYKMSDAKGYRDGTMAMFWKHLYTQ